MALSRFGEVGEMTAESSSMLFRLFALFGLVGSLSRDCGRALSLVGRRKFRRWSMLPEMVRLCGLTGAVAAGVFTGGADDVGEPGADGGLHGNLIASDPVAALLPFSCD